MKISSQQPPNFCPSSCILEVSHDLKKKEQSLILISKLTWHLLYTAQGVPIGMALSLVDLDLRVPPCCRAAMPILPDLQLPNQNWADLWTMNWKSTKYSTWPDSKPCIMLRPNNLYRLLPYADELDVESASAWRTIKAGLSDAFAVGEIRPAGISWIGK